MANEQPQPQPADLVPPPTQADEPPAALKKDTQPDHKSQPTEAPTDPVDSATPPRDEQAEETDTTAPPEPAQTEQRERPPVLPKRQENEIRSIGELLIEESIMKHDQEVAKAGEKPEDIAAKKTELSERSRANHVIQTIQWLRTDTRDFTTADSTKGFSFEDDTLPIFIDGEEKKIQYVAKFDGDNVQCFTEHSNPITISRSALERALIINERAALQDNVSPAARDGLAAYIDALDADMRGETYQLPENAQTIIETATPSTGMVLSESMRSAIDAHHKKGKLTDAEQEQMHKMLDGTLIADPDIVAHLLHRLDATPEKLTQLSSLKKSIEAEIEAQQKLGGHAAEAEDVNLTTRLTQVKEELAIYETYPASEEAVKELVFNLYNGKLPIANPERLNAAIRDDDFDKFFDELIEEGELSPEEEEKFSKLKSTIKVLGIGGAAVIALMIMQAVQAK